MTPSGRLPRYAAFALLAALCVAQSWFTFAWVERNGFLDRPFTSDAAWYRIDALRMKRGFDDGGILGWLEAGRTHKRPHPPVLPMTAGLCAALRGDHGVPFQAAWLAIQLFGALFVFGTYRLARNFGGRGLAVATAFVAASFPVVISNLRPFYPQFPMSAVLPWVLDALLRSKAFSKSGASVAFGFWAGAATMTKMLAPLYFAGAALGVTALALRGREGRRRRLANLGLAIVVAAITIVPWYGLHYRRVLGYAEKVTNSEGQQTFSYSLSRTSPARWLYHPFHFLNSGLGPPLGVVFLAAAGAGAAAIVRARRRRAESASTSAEDSRLRDGALLALSPIVAYVPLTLGQTAADSFYSSGFAAPAAVLTTTFVAGLRNKGLRVAAMTWTAAAALGMWALASRTVYEDHAPAALKWGPLPVSSVESERASFVIEALPRVDRMFGGFLRYVLPLPGRESRWPVDEYAAIVRRRTDGRRPRVTQTTPAYWTHPYCGESQFVYEAELQGLSVEFLNPETLADRPGGVEGQSSSIDFVIVDERDFPELPSLEQSLAWFSSMNIEAEVLRRDRPTDFAGCALVSLYPKGSARGPRPLADLHEAAVLKADVRFANGWTLRGVRASRLPNGRPRLTAWFDGAAASEDDATTTAFLRVGGKNTSYDTRLLRGAALCTPDRPLLAVTFGALAEAPTDAPIVFHLRVSSAREDAARGYSPVVRSELKHFPPTTVEIPFDTAAAAETRAAASRPR